MVPSLRDRFYKAEIMFLEALEHGEEEMITFEQEWGFLRDDFKTACNEQLVDSDTMSLAHIVSLRISEISQSFLSLDTASQELTASLMSDLAIIAGQQRESTPNVHQRGVSSSRRDVSLAAQWLSQNYHNPYPSHTVRDDISRRSNWNRKDVDAWFTEARKRIGWSQIRRKFFENKRFDAVQKATEFFNGQSLLNLALERALIDMQFLVHELYVDPFQKTRMIKTWGGEYHEEALIPRNIGMDYIFAIV